MLRRLAGSGKDAETTANAYRMRDDLDETPLWSCPTHVLEPDAVAWVRLFVEDDRGDRIRREERGAMHGEVMAALYGERGAMWRARERWREANAGGNR